MDPIYTSLREILRADTEYVLMNISVDNMHMLLSWYDTAFSDQVMQHITEKTRSLSHQIILSERNGLDQVVLVLEDAHSADAEQLVLDMVKQVQLFKHPTTKEPIHIRVSVGIVPFKGNVENVEELMKQAYLATNSIKQEPAQFYATYAAAQHAMQQNKEEMSRFAELQKALQQQRLCLAYQPVISAATGAAESYECLLRMVQKDGSVTTAGPMLPIAEKLGYIEQIDNFVLEQVVDTVKNTPNLTLAFNVSNLTTENNTWLKQCMQLLSDPAVAERVHVEITETAANMDMRQTSYFVAALQSLGCKVLLDDFGAGYTSFKQLRSLSVDRVKIDGSFVMGLQHSPDNELFIRTLLDFCKAYRVETVAECVETGEVAKTLMKLGVDYMQGYYFGKPDTDLKQIAA